MNRDRLRVWSRRVGVWLPALLFFLLNVTALIVYQVVFADEAAVARDAVETARGRLDDLSADRMRLESYLGAIESTADGIESLYVDVLATEDRRLTAVMREVGQLAREANLEPSQTAYPDERLEDYGLRRRSFVFNVEGSYFDLRKLINSLELSESFLTLEEVQLANAEEQGRRNLRISLRLSTLFTLDGEPVVAGRSSSREAAP